MSHSSSSLLSVRIDSAVAALLPKIAAEHELTVARAVEKLIVDEAESLNLLRKGDQGRALVELVGAVQKLLDEDPILRRDPDVTLTVFNMIRESPPLLKVYEAAIAPPPGVRAEKRRQFVHQRIGRFIKDHLGLVSVQEVTLPRDSDALIRGYTRLGK